MRFLHTGLQWISKSDVLFSSQMLFLLTTQIFYMQQFHIFYQCSFFKHFIQKYFTTFLIGKYKGGLSYLCQSEPPLVIYFNSIVSKIFSKDYDKHYCQKQTIKTKEVFLKILRRCNYITVFIRKLSFFIFYKLCNKCFRYIFFFVLIRKSTTGLRTQAHVLYKYQECA